MQDRIPLFSRKRPEIIFSLRQFHLISQAGFKCVAVVLPLPLQCEEHRPVPLCLPVRVHTCVCYQMEARMMQVTREHTVSLRLAYGTFWNWKMEILAKWEANQMGW